MKEMLNEEHPWEVLRIEASRCCSHHRYILLNKALDALRPMLLDMLGTYQIEHGFYEYPEYEKLFKLLREEEKKSS